MNFLRELLLLPWVAKSRWEGERADTITSGRVSRVVTLSLATRVPSKWLIVDRETGDMWEWRENPDTRRTGWYRPEIEVTNGSE